MVVEKLVKGYGEFKTVVAMLEKSAKNINVYFSGSKDKDNKSWCPDCVVAEPHVKEALKLAPADSVFLYVEVGERAFWKDLNCPFRTDKSIHLSVIPTLIRWRAPQRLEGEQCESKDLLEMFFTDEDE